MSDFKRNRYLAHKSWNKYHPDNSKVDYDGFVIHHKDENPLNNVKNNLQKMTHAEHTILHHKGKKRSLTSCIRMSLGQKGNKNSLGYKNGLGHTLSDEHKRKLSEVMKGNKHGIGNKSNSGRKLSDEHKRKLSQSVILGWAKRRSHV